MNFYAQKLFAYVLEWTKRKTYIKKKKKKKILQYSQFWCIEYVQLTSRSPIDVDFRPYPFYSISVNRTPPHICMYSYMYLCYTPSGTNNSIGKC